MANLRRSIETGLDYARAAFVLAVLLVLMVVAARAVIWLFIG